MEETLKYLAITYPSINIVKQNFPSYVRMYSKTSNEIVFVYVKNKSSTNGDTCKSGDTKRKSYDDELELTGSPLKLDLSLHTLLDETLPFEDPQMWSKEESNHMPVNLGIARKVASEYNHALREYECNSQTLPMWILCNPKDEEKTLLLTVHSYRDHFVRGLVTYVGTVSIENLDIEDYIEQYACQEELKNDMVSSQIDCKYIISGMSYDSCRTSEELLNAPHGGCTELYCDWTTKTIKTPFITCGVKFSQEVIIGHHNSPCSSLWRSISALYNINQLLVDMTVVGIAHINMGSAQIRSYTYGAKRVDNEKRLKQLLNDVEIYAHMAQCPPGGCICVTEDTNSLKQCLETMEREGSSNDFTYRLWDILKDSETAEELVNLLIKALKFIATGKLRPFIDASNKTYLSKLVLHFSRGHSQTSKVLKNLQSNPPQVLSLVGQVGIEKTMWEYTKVMSLIENSFFVAGIWNTDLRTQDSIDQINQTIQDMTMGGDFTLNPFESLSNTAEQSIRFETESFFDDDAHELTVDEFASLKKHGLVDDKKDVNEVPLIADEIDIGPWKTILMKFAQVHVCLEHLSRAETTLRMDFVNLKPLTTQLLEHYAGDKSPVKTVGQLLSDPVQSICVPIANNCVQDHLKKPAYWYRLCLSRKENYTKIGVRRDTQMVYAFTQQAVFPPLVWQHLETDADNVADITTNGEELKYFCTQYMLLDNVMPNRITCK